MTSAARSHDRWRETKAARTALTPLNEATSARFAACRANGGHVPSGEYVFRDLLSLPVCGRCGVPIRRGKPKSWNSSYA